MLLLPMGGGAFEDGGVLPSPRIAPSSEPSAGGPFVLGFFLPAPASAPASLSGVVPSPVAPGSAGALASLSVDGSVLGCRSVPDVGVLRVRRRVGGRIRRRGIGRARIRVRRALRRIRVARGRRGPRAVAHRGREAIPDLRVQADAADARLAAAGLSDPRRIRVECSCRGVLGNDGEAVEAVLRLAAAPAAHRAGGRERLGHRAAHRAGRAVGLGREAAVLRSACRAVGAAAAERLGDGGVRWPSSC